MSVLVVGLSHRSAPVELLERAVLPSDGLTKLLAGAAASEHVDEAFGLTTCNRLELYAAVDKFHGGVQALTSELLTHTGLSLDELTDHLYVHYEDRAVQHLFEVASGLDSMVVGEQQIVGQVRDALQAAREEGSVAGTLAPLVEHALRTAKRVHTETGIDRAGRSLVSVGLDLAAQSLGGLDGRRVLLVGAGSMSTLAATTLQRRGVTDLVVANRSADRARRLADAVGGQTITLAELRSALQEADLLVSCTGAVGTVVDAPTVQAAMAARADRPLFVLDLALPRDVDPSVRAVPAVTVADLDALRGVLDAADVAADVDEARRIVADEVAAYLARRRAERVAPTVAAVRARAQEVVEAELQRLLTRVALDARGAAEVRTTLGRLVDKLLHTPTVRVKELAGSPGGESYAELLRELFAIDPAATEAVARADVVVEDER